MQIINEELATSADELQSKNEELTHTAHELLHEQEQLGILKRYSEAIVNTIHEPLLILDKNFHISSANPAFHKFSQSAGDDIYTKPLFTFNWFVWNESEIKDLLISVLNGNIAVNDYQVTANFPAVGERVMLMTARVITDIFPLSILLAFKDITEESVAKDLMEAKNLELQAMHDELRKFTAAASHDLQEPLRKTLMFTQRILDSGDTFSEGNKNALERITVAISHMQNLISSLIVYSEQSLSLSIAKKCDLNLILKRACEEVKQAAKEKGAEFKLGDIPQLKVIPEQMKELFVCLFKNALMYCRDYEVPLIEVKAKALSQSEMKDLGIAAKGQYTKISVSDNGEGFSKSHAERIFEPFFRLHSKDLIPGSGLGLTLCKKIIKNHNGFITAESTVGKGSTFNLYLPTD